MNAPARPHTFTKAAEPTALDDQCCDLCCAVPVAAVIDGDKVCRACAEKKWLRDQLSNDDLLPLAHPAMQQAIEHYKAVVREKGGVA